MFFVVVVVVVGGGGGGGGVSVVLSLSLLLLLLLLPLLVLVENGICRGFVCFFVFASFAGFVCFACVCLRVCFVCVCVMRVTYIYIFRSVLCSCIVSTGHLCSPPFIPFFCFLLSFLRACSYRCIAELEGASLALEHRADCVVAMGGAAVIDAAKAIAAIAYADTDHKKAAKRLMEAARKPRCVRRASQSRRHEYVVLLRGGTAEWLMQMGRRVAW